MRFVGVVDQQPVSQPHDGILGANLTGGKGERGVRCGCGVGNIVLKRFKLFELVTLHTGSDGTVKGEREVKRDCGVGNTVSRRLDS